MQRIREIFSKKTSKNGMWLYALQFFNTVLPLVTLPYITRILGVTQYGVFSVAINIVTYLQVVVEFGFALSATRKVALSTEEDDLNKIFTGVTCSRILFYLACMVFVVVYIFMNHASSTDNKCLLILASSLVAYCFQENWLFQGKQDMKYIAISNVVARVLSTLCIFIFVRSIEDIILYCVLYSISPLVSNTIGTFIAVNRYKIHFVRISIREIIETIKDGMYIFFTQLSSKVFGAIGITFLGIFTTKYEVGIYSAIYKIPFMLVLLWSPISQVIYPITSKKIVASFGDGLKYISKIKKYVFLMFGFASLCIAIFAKIGTRIVFGDEYADFSYIIYPLLVWVLLGINNNFIGIQSMVGSGHDKIYSECFEIGVVFTIVANFVLIYFWGIIGASLAPAISELFLGLILKLEMRKIRARAS